MNERGLMNTRVRASTHRRCRKYIRVFAVLLGAGLFLCLADVCLAQDIAVPKFSFVKSTTDPKEVATTLEVLFLLTVLSLAPALLIMTTCFTRIVVVMSFLRKAMGTQSLPPDQIIVGLSLFLTFFVMAPVWQEVNQSALQPYFGHDITQKEAFHLAKAPLRRFMFNHTHKTDLKLFIRVAKIEKPQIRDDVPTHVLIPAFILSELKLAFIMGFYLFLPFLVIDMVVASILMSMGMMMLPPVMISLPFKLLLFVLVDGWHLLIGSLAQSYI